MTTAAVRLLRRLDGVFCVYKPPGVHWKLVRDTVETNLLKGLNAAPRPRAPSQVLFLAEPCSNAEAPRGLTLSAVSAPVLAKHPLVTGPEFRQMKVGVGHRLDASSSGVLALAVGHGNKVLNELYKTRMTRDYTLVGEFGSATHDFTDQGRVVERTTYDHITLDKLNKALAMMQGANQKALLMYSNVDMSSQEAYEMAAQGLLGPEGKSPPILTGLRCVHFKPPHFTLEVQCLNETQKYLRKVVHEMGLEMRSTAVCTGVRRTRDGPFTLRDALTRQHWTVADVTEAIKQYRPSRKTPKNSEPQIKEPGSQQKGSDTEAVAA